MKYQITCDNCGTQFVVEAGEGSTIECEYVLTVIVPWRSHYHW
ncbi:hypothetical protein ACLMOX_08010 [Prevotella histicola]